MPRIVAEGRTAAQNVRSAMLSDILVHFAAMPESHDVVVYSRKRCHLCDVVKETLQRLEGKGRFRWREVDIDSDPQLREQFTHEVPVVFIDGRKAFKYQMDERVFLSRISD